MSVSDASLEGLVKDYQTAIDAVCGIAEASRVPAEIAGLKNGRETITASAEARGRYVRQTSGPGNYGDVWLRVEPLERGK